MENKSGEVEILKNIDIYKPSLKCIKMMVGLNFPQS